MPSSPNSILKAIRQLINKNTLENANQLASLAGLTLEDPNKKIEVIEHTTKKGKVIRGVVRTDLSYAEAKAIDEFTFKKDGGWFIRDKYLGLELPSVNSQQATTDTPQNEPETVLQSDTLVKDEDNNIKGLERKFKPAAKKYKNPEIKLDTKEGVKLLKKTLTKLFPDTKFSVTMARGTAYGSAYVSWVDGASYNLVGTIAQHFRGSGFDGMTDSSHSLYALNEDGKVVDYGLGFISFSRSYSREFLEKLQSSFPDMLQNMIKQEGVTIKGDGFNAYFDAKENWTRDGIRNAQISHSTSKYNFGVVPQAENDESQYQAGENNVPSTSNALESDIKPTSTPDSQQGIKNSNDDESGQLGRMARPPVNGLDARGGSERDSSTSLSENDGISLGIGGDTSVSTGAGERGVGASNTASKSSRSSRTNEPRTPNERSRDSAVVRTSTRTGSVTQNAKEAAQLKADGTPTQWGDTANIDKALPYLLPEQRDDVAKVEKRLIEDNKNGMLFTNGTGTGKTFTGLGAVKRFANAGKKNILIVSMNDKIIRDFVKSAKALNLDIHQLDGVTDNGKDKIVATTYANLAQNLMLGKRDWDLIVVDEAHNLMQGEKGENTNALAKLRALSGHHAGFHEWVKMRHAEKDPKPIGEQPETGEPIYDQDEVAAWEAFKKPLREQWKKTWAEQPKGRTKVIFLTATPFSYVKTLDWAEGYLFDFVPPAKKFSNDTEAMGAAYNSGSEYERFYMDNFGYKMRTNRLTRPDGRVDVGILERKFAEKLKTEGAMSGRDLSVPFDYDRKFVLVNSEIGKDIDEGFKFLWDTKDKDGKSKYSDLLRVLNKRFDYLARLQLLEAIKAQEAIEQIKKHIALGRKVIVFHDYNEGGGSNPFVYVGGATQNDVGAVESQYEDFKRARPDLIALDLDLDAPITTIKKAFPDALLYNGRVAKGQRSKNADLFNTDSNGHNVLIAQSDAGATGISFHDTTGAHQRVIINIGMPSKPAKLRQTEGRIYRVGQASNAIQRYLTTGTDWERSTFSQKIAERAETVDNLAQGESAVVSIKDALVQAYEEAEYFEPSENDGIGGKAYDEENARINKLTPFERAKTDYWVKQKVTAKRQDREGKEWYATPEPVGLFMVNLSGAHSGDDILEPSAGDGAIGRYMPSDASVTFIEPSESLASRARMNNTNANVIIDSFENHNSGNKYDAIVMNPPFGQGGSIAIKHLVKAFEHLRIGGRVVALLPSGNMDNLIVDYSNKGYFAGIYQVAEFALPSSTFKNAGTAVNTKIYVFEKHENKSDVTTGFVSKNLSHYDDIEDLFGAIENINIKPRKPRIDEALAEYGLEIYPDRSKYIITGEGLKRKDITKTLFGVFVEKNKDGDVVEKYNRSTIFLKWLKDSQIPTMAQFNNGLSFNNLPIKYQQNTNKYNTWDGVGGMPDWLSTAINRYGAKLENFAVEKPVYDSVTNNDHKVIIAAIRNLLSNNTLGGAAELAILIGSSIQHGKDVITKVINDEQVEKYNQILDSQNKDEAENFLTSFISENGFNSTERMLARIKAREKSVIAFNEQQKIAEAKKKAEAKAKRESKVSIKSLTDEILAKPYLFNQKEISFLNDIKTKRKLTEKQMSWLESLAKKANVQIKGDFDLKATRQTNNISFEDYVEDFLDMSLGLMSQREKAEAYEAYQSMLKENRFDSVTNNDHKEIIAAIRKLMANNTPENARALAEAAGLSIEKPRPLLSSEDIKGLNKTLLLPDDLAVEDGDLVRILEVKELAANKSHDDNLTVNVQEMFDAIKIKTLNKGQADIVLDVAKKLNAFIKSNSSDTALFYAVDWLIDKRTRILLEEKISEFLDALLPQEIASTSEEFSLIVKNIMNVLANWYPLNEELKRIKEYKRPDNASLLTGSTKTYKKNIAKFSKIFEERRRYDSANNDTDPKEIIAAIRQALTTPSDENIQALAREAGLRIKPTIKAAKNYSDKDIEKTIKKWQELKTVGRSIIIQKLDAGWYVEKKKTGVASKYEFTNGEQYLVNSKKNGTNNVYDFIYFAMNTFGDLKTALDVSGVLNRLPQEEAANLIAKLKELLKQGKISKEDYSWSTLVINDARARDGDPYTVKSVETIKNQFISPLSAPVAPVITQSTDETSETFGEQADENIAQVQNTASQDFTLSTYTEAELRAQEAVLNAAESKRQAEEKAAKDKAFADRQVGDFRLSGSSLPSDVAASYGQNDMFVQTRGRQVEKPKNYDDFDVGTKDFLAAENFHKIAESFSDNDDRIGGIRFKVKYNKRHKDHNLKNISPIGYKVIKAMLKSAQSLIGLSSVDIKVYIEAPLFMEGAVGSADNYFVGRDNKRMASISINSKYLANAISGSDESRGQLASLADTIAHELWHIRQSYDKKLISGTIGEWTWLGKEYRRIKYENRPWEIEARKVGKALSPKIIDDLVGQNLISIGDAGHIKKAILNSNYIDYADDESAKYDDIGFNFTPAIDFDQTLKAMKTALTDSSESNIKRLAMLAGLTLKQAEPDIELDMFGEPINQDFDLFGEPIQDGEESPVEELPRLAVVELPLNKLKLSEDVPQFKSGADGESGVVEALGGKFDRTGVAPIQVWERTDGRLEIISGRHRTDLARRSGEKTIPAQVHKESEGFTAKQAMMLDAELNIRDGQGKVKDYVDYFTHSEISEDEAERRGLIARSIGQRAFTIASKGSEELKTLHRNEIISDQAAEEISNLAPSNSAMQAVGLRVLQEHKPLNNALNTIRAVMALTREKGQEPDTFDLFGFDDSALKEAEAMARIASRKQRQIAEQLNAIKGAVKNPKLAAKHGVMVENEADALTKVQTMTAQKARWDNWSSHADLLAEVRAELNDKFDSLLDDEDDYYWLCQEELAL